MASWVLFFLIVQYSSNKSKHKYWDFKVRLNFLFNKINWSKNDFIKKLCDREFLVFLILEYSRNKSKHKYWDFKWDQSLFKKINGNENDFIKKLCTHEFYFWYYNIQVTNQNTNIEELKWD
jgi:hypothetical protein